MLFSRAWKQSVWDMEKEGLPRGGRGTEPVSACKPVWKNTGRSSSGRGPVLLRGPTGQRQSPAWPLPLASLVQTFLASRATAPGRGRLRGVCQTCLGTSLGSAPLGPFHRA